VIIFTFCEEVVATSRNTFGAALLGSSSQVRIEIKDRYSPSTSRPYG